ncbi:MAG TPA: hypothetical protein DDZ62_15240 [Delftia acidovorans]|nr:hypothetical protein [Delftia acidovorans]
MIGVDADTLNQHGAISEPVVIQIVPAEVAAANASWMDADPERVAEARAARADAVPFKG